MSNGYKRLLLEVLFPPLLSIPTLGESLKGIKHIEGSTEASIGPVFIKVLSGW